MGGLGIGFSDELFFEIVSMVALFIVAFVPVFIFFGWQD